VQRCNLKDGRLIKENEPFETDEPEAQILIGGGIAKAATAPAPVKPEAPKEIQQEPEEEVIVTPPAPVQEDPPVQKEDKRRKKA